GRLAPPIGSSRRGEYLQWIHFAEGTAFPPLGVIIWHTLYAGDADKYPGVIESARARAQGGLDFAENALRGRPYIPGDDFSAADVMLAFTLGAARLLGVLDERYPALTSYLERLEARPAFRASVE